MEASEQQKGKAKPTTYVVLRFAQWEGHPEAWAEVGRADAFSDMKAIEQIAEGEGTFVAVPARSFRPRTRKVQTVERTLWE